MNFVLLVATRDIDKLGDPLEIWFPMIYASNIKDMTQVTNKTHIRYVSKN